MRSPQVAARGHIPGVVYGKKSDTVNVTVDDGDLRRVLRHGQNVLLQLEYQPGEGPGKKQYAVIKEVQRDPLRPEFLNVDLLEVYLDTEIEACSRRTGGRGRGSQDGRRLVSVGVRGNSASTTRQDTQTTNRCDSPDLGQNVKVDELESSPDYTVLSDPEEVIAIP